ncbi:MAG: putative zinc-binding metallopeptidase [Acidimicrobiales bacterium]
MRTFSCPGCAAPVFFGNVACESCDLELLHDPDLDQIVELGDRVPCAARGSVDDCNWPAVEPSPAEGAASGPAWCRSCGLDTDHDPDDELRVPFQRAKRRTIRQLLAHRVDPAVVAPPLRFELLAGTAEDPVTIGHADGLITLDLAEADPSERESVRTSLGEPYRTPLGHVRHELGHWYWQATVGFGLGFDEVRDRFGDERVDYGEALDAHYAGVDDGSWQDDHVSFYAASHPWEDFAESFAHYLHVLDTTETAAAHGLGAFDTVSAATPDVDQLLAHWAEVTVVLNELDRSMGTRDAYPFVLSPTVVDKIAFTGRSLRNT